MSALPNRDRRAERREATRREIVDAAWQIARRDGLSAVTLREVAGRIGMRSPSLYSHFDSKNAIYDAMFAEAWGELRATRADCGPSSCDRATSSKLCWAAPAIRRRWLPSMQRVTS